MAINNADELRAYVLENKDKAYGVFFNKGAFGGAGEKAIKVNYPDHYEFVAYEDVFNENIRARDKMVKDIYEFFCVDQEYVEPDAVYEIDDKDLKVKERNERLSEITGLLVSTRDYAHGENQIKTFASVERTLVVAQRKVYIIVYSGCETYKSFEISKDYLNLIN